MTLNLQLQLPPEYIDALRQHAAANGKEINAYVSHLITDHLQPSVASTRQSNGTPQDFGEWLKSWAERHPQLNHVVDDCRESIYAGCGE